MHQAETGVCVYLCHKHTRIQKLTAGTDHWSHRQVSVWLTPFVNVPDLNVG